MFGKFCKKFVKNGDENKLKKECFDARNDLIVLSDNKHYDEVVGCIHLVCYADRYSVFDFLSGIEPEDTYRVVGPTIKYCHAFNSQNPLSFKCEQTMCPMYSKYQKYITAYEKLRALKIEKSR